MRDIAEAALAVLHAPRNRERRRGAFPRRAGSLPPVTRRGKGIGESVPIAGGLADQVAPRVESQGELRSVGSGGVADDDESGTGRDLHAAGLVEGLTA